VAAALPLLLVACGDPSGSVNGASSPPPPEPTPSASPEPTPGTAVTFRTSDGVRIAGRLFGEGRVGAVLGHPIDGDQSDWWSFAEVLSDNGYTALSIDFRSYCPGGEAGCSGDGSTGDAWKDMLAGADLLRERGVRRIVLMGASMGGTAAVVAAAKADQRVAGVITLSAPTDCCGMEADEKVVEAVDAPMLFMAGRFDGDAARSGRQFARWVDSASESVILASGEHGTDLFGLATPQVERRTTALILDFLERLA
jgi:dienelactone hydrolase